MREYTSRNNKIQIDTQGEHAVLKINGVEIDISCDTSVHPDGETVDRFSCDLAYGSFRTVDQLARSIVDSQVALAQPLGGVQRFTDEPENLVDVRKNVAELSDDERNRFRDALFLLKERGGYDKYIKFHGFTDNLGHRGPAFYAWHRVFIRNFERELQQLHPEFSGVTVPYWDYTSANTTDTNVSKIWRSDFLGANGDVDLTWTGEDGLTKNWVLPGYEAVDGPVVERNGVRRRTFDVTSRAVSPSAFNDALAITDYRNFAREFEGGPHGGAHVFLGTNRDQGRFATAVNDPFFMLLHCNVDRMWAKWQQLMRDRWHCANPGMSYPPSQLAVDYYWDKSDVDHTAPHPTFNPSAAENRHNLDDVMWPWDGTETHNGGPNSQLVDPADVELYTPRQVLDLESFGYTYDTLDPTGLALTRICVPSVIEYLPTNVGQETGRMLRIKNTGNLSTRVVVAVDNAGEFRSEGTDTVLAPDQEVGVLTVFRPTNFGQRSGSLTVQMPNVGQTRTVQLRGEGIDVFV